MEMEVWKKQRCGDALLSTFLHQSFFFGSCVSSCRWIFRHRDTTTTMDDIDRSEQVKKRCLGAVTIAGIVLAGLVVIAVVVIILVTTTSNTAGKPLDKVGGQPITPALWPLVGNVPPGQGHGTDRPGLLVASSGSDRERDHRTYRLHRTSCWYHRPSLSLATVTM